MKKRKQIKIPAYAFGLDMIGPMASIAGTLEGATAPGEGEPPSTANGAMKTLGGAASGAAAGMALGPIGAIGGAVIGGIAGFFGAKSAKRKYEAQVAAAKEKKRVATSTANFNAAVANSGRIQKEYEGDDEKAYTFANGGMIKNKKKTNIPAYACGKARKCADGGEIGDSQMAYVDDGEVIRTPDGNMTEVPEQGQKQDANLVNLPEYSTILSDKLKLKQLGGKTPAEFYKSKSAKLSEAKDEYALNSAKLNKLNNDKLYEKLLGLQHIENVRKGIKNKTKSIPKYANGKGLKFTPGTNGNDVVNSSVSFTAPPISPTALTNKKIGPSQIGINTTQQAAMIAKGNPIYQTNAQPIFDEGTKKSGINFGGINFGAIASLAAPLYNLNKSREAVEEVAPIENPYANSILSASNELSNRQYNINPAIEANRRTRAVNNYNADQSNTNTGISMAMRTQGAVNEYAANADLYATKNNMENQWAGEGVNARMNAYSQLGQQSINSQAQAQQINRQARAKRDEYGAAAYTQLGEWGQMQQKYKNQANSEAIGWEAMNKFLSQGYTGEEMDKMNALYGKRGFKR